MLKYGQGSIDSIKNFIAKELVDKERKQKGTNLRGRFSNIINIKWIAALLILLFLVGQSFLFGLTKSRVSDPQILSG